MSLYGVWKKQSVLLNQDWVSMFLSCLEIYFVDTKEIQGMFSFATRTNACINKFDLFEESAILFIGKCQACVLFIYVPTIKICQMSLWINKLFWLEHNTTRIEQNVAYQT